MALLALSNLILIFFDLSYIPWRDFYFRYFRYQERPILTELYDPFKGIEPHRETQKYLDTVGVLKQQVAQAGLSSPKTQQLLQEVGNLSAEMVDSNPFAAANKTGTLERIKNRMRDRMKNDSSKQAFRRFWSLSHLNQNNWHQEIQFYERQIQPLIETNYFRHIGETGEFVDNFWKIEIWLIGLFFLEFLARTWSISRRYQGVSWLDAMLWRWYDILLWFPLFLWFLYWRWLYFIPVAIRLHQARLIDLEAIQKQAVRGLVASIAQDMTEVVVVHILSQVQGSIRQGDIPKSILQRNAQKYIDLNEINEPAEIAKLIVQLTVYQVLPQIRPDVEGLLQYSLEKALKQSLPYQKLQQLPGIEKLQANLTEQLAQQVFQSFSDTLNYLMQEDPVVDRRMQQLLEKLSQVLGSEIQAKQSLTKIEALLVDLLEEIKINYVERLSQEDVEAILQQTRAIRQMAQNQNLPRLKS